jgi:hypothetical protein
VRNELIWLRIGTTEDFHEYNNVPSNSIKGREYLEEVEDYECLTKDSTLVH